MKEIILVKITKNGEEIQREKNQYTVIDKLGSGAYGKVYKIKDLKTEEIKTLKVLKNQKPF